MAITEKSRAYSEQSKARSMLMEKDKKLYQEDEKETNKLGLLVMSGWENVLRLGEKYIATREYLKSHIHCRCICYNMLRSS
mmetsp:Transcript_1386/g.1980  ORF Transcript_1386/g.1980 Transcript_1386/m.1980 type:complete len:81 (+) Transcript_1386:1385-1627(+)